jgi:hypothetical protein
MNLLSEILMYKNTSLLQLEKMKEFYERMSLDNAIKNAAVGENFDGKMSSHQWRIGKERGSKGGTELLRKKHSIEDSKSFEDIFETTEKIKKECFGLGDLWSYDTALRIGFNMHVYPKEIYVQAGVAFGVRKALKGKLPKGRSLSLNIFPNEIQKLKAYEAENFLCIWGKKYEIKDC